MAGARGLFLFLSFVLPSAGFAAANLVLTPRFEGIQSEERVEAQRALLRGKFTADFGPYTFYLEALAEGEANEARRDERRIQDGYFLQEAYIEFKVASFFVRAGKQAMRWSEMWVTPSLDVWTARRWNRYLFDPQPEQLEHSGGVSASYAIDGFSLETFVVSEMARNRFPQPLPEFVDQKSDDVSLGARMKLDVKGFGLGLVGARAGMKDITGFAANYALESVVPKVEIGHVHDRSFIPLGQVDDNFVALGVDVFWDNWTFQPQVTLFDFGTANNQDYQSVYYLSGTWAKDKHDLQFQAFGNTSSSDSFFNLFYGYSWKDWVQTGAFVQNYQGTDGGLFTFYKRMTGGWVGGVRLEFNTSIGN